MKIASLASLCVVFLFGGCNCGEPLYALDEPEAAVTPPPVAYEEPERYILDGDAVANQERAPYVVEVPTCGDSTITIQPQAPASVWGEFQSQPGTGYQTPIQIAFTCPVRSVSVTIFDPDFPGNEMVAFDDADEVARAAFFGDNTPNVLTTDTETVSAERITQVTLIPDPNDYVAYGELTFTL